MKYTKKHRKTYESIEKHRKTANVKIKVPWICHSDNMVFFDTESVQRKVLKSIEKHGKAYKTNEKH